MKKKVISLVCAASIIGSSCTWSQASNQDTAQEQLSKSMILMVNSNGCYVNGEFKSVGDVNPVIVGDRTLVPTRFLGESLGGTVSWNDKTRVASINIGADKIDIPIDKNSIIINGEQKSLDVGGTIMNSRTMMPLRSICEAVGKNVYYDDGLILIGDSDFNQIADSDETALLKYSLKNSMLSKANISQKKTIKEQAKTSVCIDGQSMKIPYSSPKDKCLFTVGGLYVENVVLNNQDDENYSLKMDIYNTEFTYGAVEVYDSDGLLKKVDKIEPFDGGVVTASVKKYLTTVYDYGLNVKNAIVNKDFAYISYRNAAESKHTYVSVSVPKGGYVMVTTNPNDSYNVAMYDAVHAIVETLSTVTSLTAGLNSDEKLLVKDYYGDALTKLLTENKELKQKVADGLLNIFAKYDFDLWSIQSYVTNVGKDMMKLLNDLDIDIAKLVEESAGDAISGSVQSNILKTISALGLAQVEFGFGAGESLTNLSNLACLYMDFINTCNVQPVVIDLSDYRPAYKEFLLDSKNNLKSCTFGLLYINDDDIPELAISEGFPHVAGVRLYTYFGGEVKPIVYDDDTNFYGDYGTTKYKERSGLVASSYWLNGYGGFCDIIKIDGTKGTIQKEFEEIVNNSDSGDMIYKIDGKNVSKQTYTNTLNSTRKDYKTFSYSTGIKITEANVNKALGLK